MCGKECIPTPTGIKHWRDSTVLSILQNEKYRGDALLQKTFTVDFLMKKSKLLENRETVIEDCETLADMLEDTRVLDAKIRSAQEEMDRMIRENRR